MDLKKILVSLNIINDSSIDDNKPIIDYSSLNIPTLSNIGNAGMKKRAQSSYGSRRIPRPTYSKFMESGKITKSNSYRYSFYPKIWMSE